MSTLIQPVRLTNIVVGKADNHKAVVQARHQQLDATDSVSQALQKTFERCSSGELPSMHCLPIQYPQSKQALLQKGIKKPAVCGSSINWHCGAAAAEATLATTGTYMAAGCASDADVCSRYVAREHQ